MFAERILPSSMQHKVSALFAPAARRWFIHCPIRSLCVCACYSLHLRRMIATKLPSKRLAMIACRRCSGHVRSQLRARDQRMWSPSLKSACCKPPVGMFWYPTRLRLTAVLHCPLLQLLCMASERRWPRAALRACRARLLCAPKSRGCEILAQVQGCQSAGPTLCARRLAR